MFKYSSYSYNSVYFVTIKYIFNFSMHHEIHSGFLKVPRFLWCIKYIQNKLLPFCKRLFYLPDVMGLKALMFNTNSYGYSITSALSINLEQRYISNRMRDVSKENFESCTPSPYLCKKQRNRRVI